MSKQRNIIEFSIIWKKIHRMIISDSEDKLLQNWMEEDSGHLKFYKQAQRFYTEGSQFRDEQELKKAWKGVQQKTGHVQHTIVRLATMSVTVAASILVLALLFYFTNKNFDTSGLAENDIIRPGSDKAELILSNGSKHNLSHGQSFICYEGRSKIRSTGERLEYTGAEEKTDEAGIKYNTLKIPRGGKFFLQLSDGTNVWLNSGSSIHYPVQFSEKDRIVELNGEAYFEVAKNESAPFFVRSEEQVVKVIGTRFNISSYEDSKFIFTTLVDGKVEVFEKNDPRNKCTLAPGQQSVLSKKDLLVSSRKVDTSIPIAWREGRFMFDDESLVSIMQTLSRWYDAEVFFANNNRKNIRFTGNLQRSATIQEILEKIEKTEEVKFRIDNKTIIVE